MEFIDKVDRVENLLENQGGLGACLLECDELLGNPNVSANIRWRILPIRALIFGFLGVDQLAEIDLKEFEELTKSQLELQIENNRQDCPAAFVCSAAEWHRIRRDAMRRRYPFLKRLKTDEDDGFITLAIMLALIIGHIIVALLILIFDLGLFEVVLLASTVGALCAYGFQALAHELGHIASYEKDFDRVAYSLATIGSSLTNFIWVHYYWNYHKRHHAHAGGEYDRDGDILFRAWHSPPTIIRRPWLNLEIGHHALTRWLWTGFFAFAIYPMFRRAKSKLDVPHEPSIQYEGVNALSHLLILLLFGWKSLLYIVLSGAFSLGAFGHPYLQFWLTQHAFIMSRQSASAKIKKHAKQYCVPLLQPTCSSSTSNRFWHAANFGELRHVEHHDFPSIPYLRAYKLHDLCLPFYSSLDPSLGPIAAVYEWVTSSGPSQHVWMRSKGDFAGRGHHLAKLWRLMQEDVEDEAEEEDISSEGVLLADNGEEILNTEDKSDKDKTSGSDDDNI